MFIPVQKKMSSGFLFCGNIHQQTSMAALRRAIEDCHETEDSVPARGAINVLEGALRLYKPEEIAMSFNGGKDATVLLHLLRAAAAGDGGDEVSPLSLVQIRCVYFERDNVFDEVEDFIRQTESTFGLEIVRFRCSFKEGCQAMVCLLYTSPSPRDS